MDEALQPGTPAPEWDLKSTPDQSVSLADFRGKRLIMAFYPADWSPVCTDQMALYNGRDPLELRLPDRREDFLRGSGAA